MRDKKFNMILFSGLSVLAGLSVVRFIDNTDSWLIDIFSHFPMQYALLASVLLLLSLWRRSVVCSAAALLILVFNLSIFTGPARSVQASVPAAGTFDLYSANLHVSNDDISGLAEELERTDPDMVLLLEVTPRHRELLGPVTRMYPYRIQKSYYGEREIGFIFLSRFKVLSNKITWLSDVCNFLLEAEIDIGGEPVMFYGLHARRPDMEGFSRRRDQFLRLAELAEEQDIPVIIAGDFNSTPFAPIFRKFLTVSGLKDSGAGFGWQPTWPTSFPFLWIEIDHILVSPGVRVLHRSTGAYTGSDHYPVFAELAISD